MPEPVEPATLTAAQKAKLRAAFKQLGREEVRHQLHFGGFGVGRGREEAKQWLQEKDAEAERRERDTQWYLKATFWAVLLTLGVAVWALPSERINAILARGAELMQAARGFVKR
jgi:hypothetical protein